MIIPSANFYKFSQIFKFKRLKYQYCPWYHRKLNKQVFGVYTAIFIVIVFGNFWEEKFMLLEWLRQYAQPILNFGSINYIINVYVECLGYLFPVLITYLWTKDIKKTIFLLTFIILARFLIAFYHILKSQQQPKRFLKYANCTRSYYIDPIEKEKLEKQCQVKYEKLRTKLDLMNSQQKNQKQAEIESVMKQLQQKEFKIFYKWQ